jgi:hypothetical protein
MKLRACAIAAALCVATAYASTGGEEPLPTYNAAWGPVRPLADVAGASLGVVEPSWFRRPLLLAWLRFNEIPVRPDAVSAFGYKNPWQIVEANPGAWSLAARGAAPDLAPERPPQAETVLPSESWGSFTNCPVAAWDQATATLAARKQAWGEGSPALRDWIAVQHRVLARCALGPKHFRTDLGWAINPDAAARFLLPVMTIGDPPAGSPPLLAKDRAYQRASALLYEGRYAEAEVAFAAIARDAASPWKDWGTYLALRARLRRIQVTPAVSPPQPEDHRPEAANARKEATAWRTSEATRLRADIGAALADARKRGATEEARRLAALDTLAGARVDPGGRMRELAVQLAQAPDAATQREAIGDYVLLHRQWPPADTMGEWLAGLIDSHDAAERVRLSEKSLARYLQHPTQRAWLFSAAALAQSGDPHLAALRKALADVPDKHPGATTFLLQRVRLSERAVARPLADALLKRPDVLADYSARNRVRQYRMLSAATLEEFWADALREPGAGIDPDTLLPLAPPSGSAPTGWDADASWILNHELPLAVLMATARRSGWSGAARSQIATMAWARAVLLGDARRAREALKQAANLEAQLAAYTDDTQFLMESKLALWKQNLLPVVGEYQSWCTLKAVPSNGSQGLTVNALNPVLRPGQFAARLLSADEVRAWKTERAALEALPPRTNVVMQNALAFAARYPDDPRVPSLLRDTVYATRLDYCGDAAAGAMSKQALDLLKKKYPQSNEAKRTKYWFKPGS